ncbi:unnamed protein product [Ectocarpus sp. 8 AP-2014]
MAQANQHVAQAFHHDAFGAMMPYLDDGSKARIVQTKRAAVGNHQLCKPDANVYRTHAVNGMCPAYATTLDIDTDCCTTSFQNANPSDREFLMALNHGYRLKPAGWNPQGEILDEIVPDFRRWFKNGRHTLPAVPAAMPQALVINMTRDWFPLVMKFYILTGARFRIDAFDPVTNATRTVYFAAGKVVLDRDDGFTLRRRLVKCIQEVGAQSVVEHHLSDNIFTPFALKCNRYVCRGAGVVDITDMANVVSDARCGLRNVHFMEVHSVAAVRTGSWVDAFVEIFLAALRRPWRVFSLQVWHRNLGGAVHVPDDMTPIPTASGPIAEAQQYQPVVDDLVAKLPGDSWEVEDVSDDALNWERMWIVTSNVNNHSFRLEVHRWYSVTLQYTRV